MSDMTDSLDRKRNAFEEYKPELVKPWAEHLVGLGDDVRLRVYPGMREDGTPQTYLVAVPASMPASEIQAIIDNEGTENPGVLEWSHPCPPEC